MMGTMHILHAPLYVLRVCLQHLSPLLNSLSYSIICHSRYAIRTAAPHYMNVVYILSPVCLQVSEIMEA